MIFLQEAEANNRTAASDYTQLYRGDVDTLTASLERIRETAATILAALLPTKVMRGAPLVRSPEDLEGGALTYAEITAITSGNPAGLSCSGLLHDFGHCGGVAMCHKWGV